MKSTNYADLIANTHFTAGMIRMDVASIDTTKKIDKKKGPALKINQEIVMTMDGFLRSYDNMKSLIDKLIEKDIIKKNKSEKIEKK